MVQEAVPLFSNPGSGFTLDNEWNAFATSFFVALISILFLVKKIVKEKYNFKLVFLIVWTLIILTLTILQRRFIYLLAVNTAILSAYFITSLVRFLSLNPNKEKVISKIYYGLLHQEKSSVLNYHDYINGNIRPKRKRLFSNSYFNYTTSSPRSFLGEFKTENRSSVAFCSIG